MKKNEVQPSDVTYFDSLALALMGTPVVYCRDSSL